MTRKMIAALIAITPVAVSTTDAYVIEFSGLSQPNGTPFTSYDEDNFTVAVNTGEWLEAHSNGNPTPDIFGRSAVGSVDVTENTTGLFTFNGVDLDDASGGGFTYQITGFRNNVSVLSFGGAFPGGQFPTIVSPDALEPLDTLNIQINSTTSSYNIDNIVVDTVPEPASAAVLAAMGVYGLRRPRGLMPGR